MWFKDKNAFSEKRYTSAADSRELVELHRLLALAFASRAESRSGSRKEHINRVGQLTGILARAMLRANYPDFSMSFADNIILASVLHDVGKIAVSDAVLNKEGELSRAEAEEMMRHSVEGGKILSEIAEKLGGGTYIAVAAVIAKHHHERYNGCGYPDRLKGGKIPLPARIVAIADGFDVLAGEKKMSPNEAAGTIREFAGVYYDPALVEIFLENMEEIKKLYE